LERPENKHHRELLDSRDFRKELWPEPETTALYKTLYRGALRIAYGILGRHEKEFAQEVATHVMLHLDEFHGHSKFSTWFYTLARNEIVRYSKRRRRLQENSLDSIAEPSVPPKVPLMLPSGLTERERMLATLVTVGHSFNEIGRLLGRPKHEVYYEWTQLRDKLKCLLTPSSTS
jgi:DNA-directed RNA polymerase specialized sigma24 family protein